VKQGNSTTADLIRACAGVVGTDADLHSVDEAIALLGDRANQLSTDWLDTHAAKVKASIGLTKELQLSPLVVIAATIGLTTDRYGLAARWRKTRLWSDLEWIAAASCERLPSST
jgi:hypothetical protein